MGDFERRRQSSEHSDGARASDAHAMLGKTTRLETCLDNFANKHSTRRVAGREVVGGPQHAQASEGRR
jgi:hypothetical protein